jgi:uncharacterized protein (DUF885 family)
MTADEIFELGQKEVGRIRKEIENNKATSCFEGDLKAFYRYWQLIQSLLLLKKMKDVVNAFNQIYEGINSSERTIQHSTENSF